MSRTRIGRPGSRTKSQRSGNIDSSVRWLALKSVASVSSRLSHCQGEPHHKPDEQRAGEDDRPHGQGFAKHSTVAARQIQPCNNRLARSADGPHAGMLVHADTMPSLAVEAFPVAKPAMANIPSRARYAARDV